MVADSASRGAAVAELAATTLLGQPARSRQFRYGPATPAVPANPAHAVFVAKA